MTRRLEDRLSLSRAEKRGVELIRQGCFPETIMDAAKAREFRGPNFSPANGLVDNEWNVVRAAVIDHVPLNVIAAWYRTTEAHVETAIRRVLHAYVETEKAHERFDWVKQLYLDRQMKGVRE